VSDSILEADVLALPGLQHGFTTRLGGASSGPWGSLNLSHRVGDEPAAVAENRRRFEVLSGRDWSQVVCLNQVHGRAVLVVERPAVELPPEDARRHDACVSLRADVVLAVRTADCVPILLYDPVRRAVGVAHAGWRGTLAGVATAALEALVGLGCRPGDVRAALGPCIQVAAYGVGPEVHAPFLARFGPEAAPPGGQGLRVDLAAANRRLLLEAGLAAGHIQVLPRCTFSEPAAFFSHRRDRGLTGRHLAYIALRS